MSHNTDPDAIQRLLDDLAGQLLFALDETLAERGRADADDGGAILEYEVVHGYTSVQ